MIYELKEKDYRLVADLMNERSNIMFRAVIEGNNPGWVFVDNVEKPNTALIWSRGIEGFYFTGKEDNQDFNYYINQFVDDVIIPRLKVLNINWFEVNGDGDMWNSTIESIFKGRSLFKSYQYVYRLNRNDRSACIDTYLDGCFEIHAINKDLFENKMILNKDFLTCKVESFWGSADAFMERGIGYCVVCGNTIVSLCFSGFVAGNTHSIDIFTLENYRRKKLAQSLVMKFISESIKIGIEPYWDCMQENIASYSLAESVGFKKDYQYTLYWFNF